MSSIPTPTPPFRGGAGKNIRHQEPPPSKEADWRRTGETGGEEKHTRPRRYLCLWLPRLSTDRLTVDGVFPNRGEGMEPPLAVIETVGNRVAVRAVNAAATAAGIDPGTSLASARAICPGIATVEADPAADAATLEALARWAERFTPLVALEPEGRALLLDVTGCAHLHGGEPALLAAARTGLEDIGFTAEAALAGTPAAAAILARYAGPVCLVTAEASLAQTLAPIPVVALGLAADPPAPSVLETLAQVGLRRFRDLYTIPRAALTARFGRRLADALDTALGPDAAGGKAADRAGGRLNFGGPAGSGQPIGPLPHRRPWRIRLAFPEPIGTAEDIAAALDRLLARLCRRLEAENRGCRRLRLNARRTDGTAQDLEIGTARPERDPVRLAHLFEEKLTMIDPGYGIDAFLLEAPVVELFENTQQEAAFGAPTGTANDPAALGGLIDRLVNRLGDGAVLRLRPARSHRPDTAQTATAPLSPAAISAGSEAPAAGGSWPETAPRPIRLLIRPRPLQLLSAPRDGEPPLAFRLAGRRCHVRIASGPERIAPDWWRRDARWAGGTRDYFRVELEDGRRLWIYRDGALNRDGGGSTGGAWFLEGVFA